MRGLSIGIFLLCVGVAITALVGIGFTDQVPIGGDSPVQDDTKRVEDELGGTRNISDTGEGGSFLGFTTHGTNAISVLFQLFTSTSAILQNWGIPRAIADGIQTIVVVIGGFMIVQFIRGVVAE